MKTGSFSSGASTKTILMIFLVHAVIASLWAVLLNNIVESHYTNPALLTLDNAKEDSVSAVPLLSSPPKEGHTP